MDNKNEKNEVNITEKYKKFHENELKIENITDFTPVVKRAYCPQCGKEIINDFPVVFNPYTFEKFCKYDCTCGWYANLDYSYPRLVAKLNNGEEIEVFVK
mgnify:FL=1